MNEAITRVWFLWIIIVIRSRKNVFVAYVKYINT